MSHGCVSVMIQFRAFFRDDSPLFMRLFVNSFHRDWQIYTSSLSLDVISLNLEVKGANARRARR